MFYHFQGGLLIWKNTEKMKTQNRESTGHPFNPGDKVTNRGKSGYPRTLGRWGNYAPSGKIHTVRQAGVHPVSGRDVVWLVGINGDPHEHFEEAPFDAASFKAVWISQEPLLPVAPEVIEIPVKVTKAVADELRPASLYPNVEKFFTVQGEDWLERVCHRWTNRISNLGMHATLEEYHASITRTLIRDECEIMIVPLSPLAHQNALEIIERLGIDLEAWLQALLAHCSTRRVKWRESEAIQQARSERADAAKAKRDALRLEKESKRNQLRGGNQT